MLQVAASGEEVLYITGRASTLESPTQLMLEVRFSKSAPGIKAFTKSTRPDLAPFLFEALPTLLS